LNHVSGWVDTSSSFFGTSTLQAQVPWQAIFNSVYLTFAYNIKRTAALLEMNK
jgi:hypothetical protein